MPHPDSVGNMKNTFRVLLFGFFVFILGGCGFIDYFFLPPPEDTAQELYEAGMEAMKEKHYMDAQEYFSKLKDRYPFSPYTPKGLVALGDAYFLDEQYVLAIDAYKEFEAMHPRHEDIPYALFQIGLSGLQIQESVDRPQDHLLESIQYFTLLEETYPQTEYGQQAGEYVLKCRLRLAEHELFVADFYMRTGEYGAAWKRYTYTVENFQDLPDVVENAKIRAHLAFVEYKKTLTEAQRQEVQGSWSQFLKKWL